MDLHVIIPGRTAELVAQVVDGRLIIPPAPAVPLAGTVPAPLPPPGLR
jgi:hypothetical protein